ncbi:hypothetical protein PTSG_04890 [Salpingoeca rosetta]|uniref:PH domain-containing protein n=1 Tax=Salpingoeca rosetta (strain ATCC 50818 / BSB-021) TaxID=946362 RepID=F2U8X4_SALR5|nr:uncharacterized protein PTSG_04890 [Salpingoeca rosetta]EGD73177.1 hypothetical protein PTSG_04890 [Salpingoeca rosetta]|eukprot:XP_004994208.1 hypothetical protein PTSG_04890 [Salpingoeca rosetta]
MRQAQESMPFADELDPKTQEKEKKKKKKKDKEALREEEARRQRQIKQQQRRAKLNERHQKIRDKYGLEGGMPVITPCEEKPPKQEDLTGYLLKRGKVNTAFKKRWFQIEDGQLSYHKHSFEAPCGFIRLSDIKRVRLLDKQSPPELLLETSARTFVLRSPSDSSSELQAWAAAIDLAIP